MTSQQPTSTSRAARRLAVATLALTAGLGLAACGSDPSGSDARDASASPTPASPPAASSSVDDTVRPPVAGTIRIDGEADALTDLTAGRYRAGDADYRVEQDSTGDTRAFQRLCVGDVDVVDASRPISPDEWAGCHARGLDVVQFQVAADAVVLATQNQSVDVGTDCLSVGQAKRIFQNGSTITNWSEAGPDLSDIPLSTAGPGIGTPDAQFFGAAVLGSPEPSVADFRADYRVDDSSDATRIFVAGKDADRRLALRLGLYGPQREALASSFRYRTQELEQARKELKTALHERRKGIRDNRPPRQKAADQARVDAAFAARSTAINRFNLARSKFVPINVIYKRLEAAQARLSGTKGHLGLFKFSYYQVYEDQLRPFEIQLGDSDDANSNCIFPSVQTIVTGQYPLSRPLLLTTTTRSLRRAEVKSYLSFYLQHSQKNAVTSSVVPLPDGDVATQLGWIKSGKAPVISSVDGGPVIVQPDEETEAPGDGTDTPSAPASTSPGRPAR